MNSRAIYFFAVLVVVVSNVLFAPGWQSGPLSPMPKFKVPSYGTPATPTKIDGPNAVLKSNTIVTRNTSAMDNIDTPLAQIPAQPSPIDNTPVEQTLSKSKCDISACTRAYRSFRESDCTYQPSTGPRRLCTKGVVATEPGGKANARCNVNACAAAYRSFSPSDCTYQSSIGQRRLCAK